MISSIHKKSPASPARKPTAGSSTTILVVDDQEPIRTLLFRALTRTGHSVLAADDGQMALSLLDRERIDLVLSDVDMPNLSGIELLRELRERGRSVPVVIITGQPTVEAAVECMKGGAFDYITKPFALDRLYAIVNAALKGMPRSSNVGATTQFSGDFPSFLVDYDIIDTLGEGSMGIVYLGRKKINGRYRRCAIKLYKLGDQNSQESERMQKRFLQEAKALLEALT